ncbi:SH3 domain-binding protein 5-like [Mizuhopecten yessoensis]|nr:SH3 domain-binding protein 5-like [Mizuhopecten yessoensis]
MEARAKYRMTFADASHKMALISKDKKKSIQKAREYYELREEAKKVQSESLKSARQYQSAIGIYRAAKETVALAEERLLQGGEVQLTSAWQEMLNHATIRVMEAEREKRISEEKHQKTTFRWRDLEKRTHELQRKFKRAISNARSYFEMKQQLDLRLQQQKQNVLDLQQAIKGYKVKYADTLRTLEQISESIHESRRQNLILMFPRQPGVGAESTNVSPSLSELTLEKLEDRQTWMTDEEMFHDDDVDEDFQKSSIHSADSFVSLDAVSELTSSNSDITKQVSSSVDEVMVRGMVNNRLGNSHEGIGLLGAKSFCDKTEPERKTEPQRKDEYAESERERGVQEEIHYYDTLTDNVGRLSVCGGNDTTESGLKQVHNTLHDDQVLHAHNKTSHSCGATRENPPLLQLNTKHLQRNQFYTVKGEYQQNDTRNTSDLLKH